MNQNPTLNISLELSEINAILSALPELPAKICNPLTEKIKSQAVPQLQNLQAAKPDETAAE